MSLQFSKGWLQQFKNHYGLLSVVQHGEQVSAHMLATTEGSLGLQEKFYGYSLENMCNADEFRLQLRPLSDCITADRHLSNVRKK